MNDGSTTMKMLKPRRRIETLQKEKLNKWLGLCQTVMLGEKLLTFGFLVFWEFLKVTLVPSREEMVLKFNRIKQKQKLKLNLFFTQAFASGMASSGAKN